MAPDRPGVDQPRAEVRSVAAKPSTDRPRPPKVAPPASVTEHPSQPVPDPIPNIIPSRKVSLLAGAAGVGKTTILAGFARRWRDGEPICGKPVNKPVHIAFIAADRGWDSHQKWFDAVGYGDIEHYSLQDDMALDWDRILRRDQLKLLFLEALNKVNARPGSLILVDPISIFVPGNLIDYKTTAAGLGHLNRICKQRGVTVIGTAHMSKQKSDARDRYLRPQDRILGSAALAGFTDTQMYLLAPEDLDEDYYGFGWIPHHAPAETFHFIRDPETGLFTPYLQQTDSQGEQVQALLTAISADEGATTKALVEMMGEHYAVARATVYRQLHRLEKQKEIIRGGVRGTWKRGPGLSPVSPENAP